MQHSFFLIFNVFKDPPQGRVNPEYPLLVLNRIKVYSNNVLFVIFQSHYLEPFPYLSSFSTEFVPCQFLALMNIVFAHTLSIKILPEAKWVINSDSFCHNRIIMFLLNNGYWVTPNLALKSESSGLASQSVSVYDIILSCHQQQGAHANG